MIKASNHSEQMKKSQKIFLREISLGDAAFFLELMSSEEYKKSIGDRGITSLEKAQDYIQNSILPNRIGLLGYRIVCAQGEPVGIVGLLNRTTLPEIDLGFAVLKKFQKRGFAYGASRLLIDEIKYAQDHPSHISAITHLENQPSQDLLLKLGFTYDQRLLLTSGPSEYFRLDLRPPIGRQRKNLVRCGRCYCLECLCQFPLMESPHIELVMIAHVEELKRPSSTGRLAMRLVKPSFLVEQGRERLKDSYNSSQQLFEIAKNGSGLSKIILSADEDALDIEDYASHIGNKKIQLFVVDGSWRQASKLTRKWAERLNLQKVKLSSFALATEHNRVIRKEHFENGRSTLQATAEAFYRLGQKDIAIKLLTLYQQKLDETLKNRTQF